MNFDAIKMQYRYNLDATKIIIDASSMQVRCKLDES